MIVNKVLAAILELAEVDCLFSRLTAIKEMDENPMGVDIQTFGQAVAFSVKNIPGPTFNTVKGLKDGDEVYIDEIIDFYEQKEIPVRLELTPAHVSTDFLIYLSEKGFYQYDFHTTLFRPSHGEIEPLRDTMNSPISIRELRENEFETYADIYTKGFQMPSFLKSGVAKNNEILYDNEDWTFYLASVGKEPSGIPVLFIKDNIATLAAAATVPEFRNKGIQSALIKQRILHANKKQCNLVVGQAKFGSVSQNNMERAGLKIAYTKSLWIKK